MQTRYFLEMFFYFVLMCVLQYQLSQFTDAFNLVLTSYAEIGEDYEKAE